MGITDEDKKRLFTRGFRKNTGLGLFLSREILAITGITITENGTTGKGARFEIAVPKGARRFASAACGCFNRVNCERCNWRVGWVNWRLKEGAHPALPIACRGRNEKTYTVPKDTLV